MNRKLLIAIAFCLAASLSFSQDLHSIADIIHIIDTSKLVYSIGIDTTPISENCPDYSANTLDHFYYQEVKNSSKTVGEYKLSYEAEIVFGLAESAFMHENYDSALYYYNKVATMQPGFSPAITYAGQVYEKKHNDQAAIAQYKKAIGANYFDYMAHWFLADAYDAIGNNKDAVSEITIASILNRDNPRLKEALQRIYKAAYSVYRDWCFVPQYQLSKMDNGDLSVKFAEPWMSYALVKAVWKYQPGYRESMGGKLGDYSLTEDREALYAMAAYLYADSSQKWKSCRSLVGLDMAVKKKMFNEYLLYEVILPKYPKIVFAFDRESIDQIKDYVMYAHTHDQ
ncbi:MAG: hypothetical protein JST70_10105 [Bacteroidetes bacterium]|nr:hypothetical protein [Bacteroidota bacterium]